MSESIVVRIEHIRPGHIQVLDERLFRKPGEQLRVVSVGAPDQLAVPGLVRRHRGETPAEEPAAGRAVDHPAHPGAPRGDRRRRLAVLPPARTTQERQQGAFPADARIADWQTAPQRELQRHQGPHERAHTRQAEAAFDLKCRLQ